MIGIFGRVNTPIITNFDTSIQIHSINQPNDFRIAAGHSLGTEFLTKDFSPATDKQIWFY